MVEGSERAGDDYRFEMSDAEHVELAAVLREAKGMVVISGYACPLYDDLYSDWQVATRVAYADQAQKRVEALWLNEAAWTNLHREKLTLFQ